MKKIKIILITLYVCCFISCSDDDKSISDAEDETPELAAEIEVYNSSAFEDNYVFVVENGGTTSYLLNKEGFKVKEWNFQNNIGHDLEILSDGKILGMFKSENPAFSFGGYGGKLMRLNIDGSVDWEYELSTQDEITHHDFELLPNGNILFLVWERIPSSDLSNLGIDFTNDVFTETVKEVNPETNQIVWEWHSKDHLIQDQFPLSTNYGNVALNPQKININYNLQANGDFMHANGLAYDSDKDVVYLSVNFFSEIWVIDHSTSTLEASSASGGNYNKGGDLLYRFGNPTAYNNTEGERILYKNHFPNLLKGSLPGAGNLLIYNNGYNINQSSVYEIEIPQTFNVVANTDNEPNIVWSFTDETMFCERISGAVRLENGNTLITEGDFGIWEVTSSGEVVWKYHEEGSFWRSYAYSKDAAQISALGL